MESNIYDKELYQVAMKKFYEDVRGMLPDSSEYNEIRNNAYWELHWLSKEKTMKEQSTIVYEANEDTIEFILIYFVIFLTWVWTTWGQ